MEPGSTENVGAAGADFDMKGTPAMNAAGAAGDGETFELVPLAGGLHSLRSLANGQTFHPVVGPAAEAERLHVAGTRLVERANALPPGRLPVVWDVGLGAAANALAAIRALAAGYRRPENVMLYSYDRSLSALEFALAHAVELGYPLGYEAALRSLLARGGAEVVIGNARVQWQVVPGDFTGWRGRRGGLAPDAIFYDPYSPSVNPEMWTLELFTALRAGLRDDTPCLLTNYTRSTAVRVTLLLAGFYVGIGPSTGEKDETTVATNDPALLERPLSRAWLERKVYASTNAAPLRAGASGARGPIDEKDFDRLGEHKQFAGSQSWAVE